MFQATWNFAVTVEYKRAFCRKLLSFAVKFMHVLKPDTVKLPFKQYHFQLETEEFACGEITLIAKEARAAKNLEHERHISSWCWGNG